MANGGIAIHGRCYTPLAQRAHNGASPHIGASILGFDDIVQEMALSQLFDKHTVYIHVSLALLSPTRAFPSAIPFVEVSRTLLSRGSPQKNASFVL